MSKVHALVTAASGAAPTIRRAIPRVTELFRGGTLYPPAPAAEVVDHIIARRAVTSVAGRGRTHFSSYYSTNDIRFITTPASETSTAAAVTKDVSVPAATALAPPHASVSRATAALARPHANVSGAEAAFAPSLSSGVFSTTTVRGASAGYSAASSASRIISSPYDFSSRLSSNGNAPSLVSKFTESTDSAKLISNNSTDQQSVCHESHSVEEEVLRRRRRCTVLFTWLGAKERYAHKYIELWTRRGHSVLHVTCSITDLLMPKTGAEVTADYVKDYISSLSNWRVLVHGLSVGGFITQHVLKDDDPSVTTKLSHQIYDSFTNVEGLADGVENAVPSRFSTIARTIGDLYMKYADLSSFNQARNFILDGKANSPVFFMHSMADRVASYERTKPLITAMQQKAPVALFLVPAAEEIPHVALLRKMGPPSYMDIIETFLESHKDPVL